MTTAKRRNIEDRFTLLEDRVFKIELRLGPETSSPATPAPGPTAVAQAASAPAIPNAAPKATPKAAPDPAPSPAVPVSVKNHARSTHATPPPLPVAAPVAPVQIAYATPVPPAPHVQGTFERTLGLKWAGWLGALLFMVGAAFLVKFVYDHQWFAQVPPAIWLSGIFLAGAALIGVGELIYRRVHVVPAAAVFGAGIATLFLAGYVGQAYYSLYAPGAALFLMAAAALVGALVAMRGNLVSIAVLSHLGANIAPLLVGSRSAPLESFLIYLLALQMVSLTLASWGRGKKWWTLRGLSLVTTSLWIVGTGLRPGEESLVLVFSIVYAALYHGELIHSVLRRRDDASPTVGGSDAVTFSLVVTAALALATLWATRIYPPEARGATLLAMAAIFALLGWVLLRIRTDATVAIRRISIAHRTAAVALLALAIPAALSGLNTDIGWGVLAIAMAVSGHLTRSKIARIASIAIWIAGIGHLALAAGLPPELGGHRPIAWFSLSGTSIAGDAVMAWGLSIVGQVVAALLKPRSSPTDGANNPSSDLWTHQTAITLSVLATVVWVVASFLALPPLAATAWIVEYAWLLVAFDALAPQLRLSQQTAGLLILAIAKWMIVDTLADRLAPGWSPATYRPVLNPMVGIGGLLCTSIVTFWFIRCRAFGRSQQRRADVPNVMSDEESMLRRLSLLLVALIVLWMGSIEIDRYFASVPAFIGTARPEQVTLSIFWAIFAVACVLLGFRVRAAALRFFGLALLAITLLKVVLIDMSQVQTGYRILSFMGLGAVLLGTSVLYGKFGPRLLRESEEDEESQVSVG
jgi:uncharacterized membrane protein